MLHPDTVIEWTTLLFPEDLDAFYFVVPLLVEFATPDNLAAAASVTSRFTFVDGSPVITTVDGTPRITAVV